jgi:hypothetical protein
MWKNPCGTPSSTQTISPLPISLKNALDSLRENAAYFIKVVSDIKDSYVRHFKEFTKNI